MGKDAIEKAFKEEFGEEDPYPPLEQISERQKMSFVHRCKRMAPKKKGEKEMAKDIETDPSNELPIDPIVEDQEKEERKKKDIPLGEWLTDLEIDKEFPEEEKKD